MDARLLPGGDAVVAAVAVQRLGVEVVMRGAGLERVGRREVATFRFQVGTHLNTDRQVASETEKCSISTVLQAERLTEDARG